MGLNSLLFHLKKKNSICFKSFRLSFRFVAIEFQITEDAEVIISGNDDKDGAFKIGLSLKPTKSTEGDARKKKDNGMGVLIAAAALKIGLLKALAFKALALLVGKALLVSKVRAMVSPLEYIQVYKDVLNVCTRAGSIDVKLSIIRIVEVVKLNLHFDSREIK